MTNTEQILSSPSSCFNLFLTMALLAEQSQETVMISWTNSILQKHEQKKPGQNEQPMTGSMQEETKKKWFCLSTERFNYWNSLITRDVTLSGGTNKTGLWFASLEKLKSDWKEDITFITDILYLIDSLVVVMVH